MRAQGKVAAVSKESMGSIVRTMDHPLPLILQFPRKYRFGRGLKPTGGTKPVKIWVQFTIGINEPVKVSELFVASYTVFVTILSLLDTCL